jgi:hypothetical protein
MKGEQHPRNASLRAARERVVERLSEAFAKDELGLEEFERRVDAAYGATDEAAVVAIVRDIEPAFRVAAIVPAEPSAVVVVERSVALELAGQPRGFRALAVLGNAEHRGQLRLEHGGRATAVFGNVELDLRDVAFPPGVTRLEVKAVFGNVEITVPPDVAVQCEGSGVLGSFAALHRLPPDAEDLPVLHVIGVAVFGNVEIHTRPRGAQGDRRLPRGRG